MSLNHVSYWENKDWHHVTAKEASKKSHHNTIRADEKRLLCDLCNHFVSLSVGEKREPYFKHSRGDINKNCPERSNHASFKLPTHFAGLKIVIDDKKQKFHLELVLPHAANPGLSKYKNLGIYHKHNKKIQKITPGKINSNAFSIKINLGSTVANKYTLYDDLPDHSNKIADFKILQSRYLIFRSSDGMRVNLGGELNPNNKYIVLTTKDSFTYPGINEKLLAHSNNWKVFQISFDTHFGSNKLRPFLQINDLSNDAGIDYRITKNVADVDLIWPEHFKNEDGINYLGDTLYLYKHGQAWLDYAPRSNKRSNNQDRLLQLFENPQLFPLKPNDDNGIVVAYGRNVNDITNYKQFIPCPQSAKQPGNDLSLKSYLKEHNHYINPLYNATLKQYVNKFEVSSQSLEANKPFRLPNLVAGSSLKVFYGADCVFSQTAKVSKPQSEPSQFQPSTTNNPSVTNDQSRLNDSKLISLLKKQTGETATFTIVSNQLKKLLADCPTTYQWVCAQARQRSITIKAKNILNKIVNGEYY